jgi:hypothetical protein
MTENSTMTRLRILSAAAILSMKTATRVFAEAAIQGLHAFHPNSAFGLGGAMVAVPFRNSRSHLSSRQAARNQGIER